MLQTSILERLNAELCEALLVEKLDAASDLSNVRTCQQTLEYLSRSNLFVVNLDDEGHWYRYHPLFADLLLARLRQDQTAEAIAVLHQQAAAWYERADMAPEAIEHALMAADYAHAVRLIEKVALPMILQAYISTIEAWLQAIPQAYLERNPRINMAFAWMHLLRGTLPQAAPYLQNLETFFSVPEPGADDPSLQGEWFALQSRLRNMEGKPAESRDLAERALRILPPAEAHVRSMILVNLATAYTQMLDYERAAETFQMIVRDAQAAGDEVSVTLGLSGQAQMLLQQGKLHQAFDVASQGIKRLEESGKENPFSATLHGEIGQIYYHWHQLDQAQSYLLRSMQTSGQSGYSDPEIFYHVARSRMFQMAADWAASAREMQQAGDLMRKTPPAMIREEVISQQVRVDLALGRQDAAQAILQAEGFSFEGGFSFPAVAAGSSIAHPLGLLYNSTLRVLLSLAKIKGESENLEVGIELAMVVLAGELQRQHLPIALETLLLRAQLYAALGENHKSLMDLAKAVELAEPEGFISIFVEEGELMREALTSMLKRSQLGRAHAGFIREVLGAFPREEKTQAVPDAFAQDEIPAQFEPLTAREMEVLQLIAAGDSNRTIAEKLVITVSAVKKHSANIYGKLSVNSRTQAVARGRQLGLLSGDE